MVVSFSHWFISSYDDDDDAVDDDDGSDDYNNDDDNVNTWFYSLTVNNEVSEFHHA